MVVKAEYRGTNVAVKRVIPPRAGKIRESIFDKENKGGSVFGTGISSVSAGSGDKDDAEEGDYIYMHTYVCICIYVFYVYM